MTTQSQQMTVPPDWEGSIPEYMVYRSLIERHGKQPGVDFSYQSALMGGRLDKGGVVLDFVFTDPRPCNKRARRVLSLWIRGNIYTK